MRPTPEVAVPDAIDAHFHVIGDPTVFPPDPERSYTPSPAPLVRWRATLAPLGVTRGVVVQPSFYGTDNRALLAALAEGGSALRGVAAVRADVTDQELDRLVAAGVRAVRLAHFAAHDPQAMRGFVRFDAFESLAPRLRHRDMHVELLTDSRLLPALEDRLRRARLTIVIDHMGRTPARLGTAHAGVQWLRRALADGLVWVKLSGAANLSAAAPEYEDMRPLHELLVAANPEQVVWGSDWPHTKARAVATDTVGLLQKCVRWTPDARTRDRVLRDNARRLYRFDDPQRV